MSNETDRAFSYDDMLMWRGIDRSAGTEPCPDCGGSGVKVYGDTSTWRKGIGGQMIMADVCDKCWGSGNAKEPWINLREHGCVRY